MFVDEKSKKTPEPAGQWTTSHERRSWKTHKQEKGKNHAREVRPLS